MDDDTPAICVSHLNDHVVSCRVMSGAPVVYRKAIPNVQCRLQWHTCPSNAAIDQRFLYGQYLLMCRTPYDFWGVRVPQSANACVCVCAVLHVSSSPTPSTSSPSRSGAIQRSETSIKQMLLDWCRSKVKGYKVRSLFTINITTLLSSLTHIVIHRLCCILAYTLGIAMVGYNAISYNSRR